MRTLLVLVAVAGALGCNDNTCVCDERLDDQGRNDNDFYVCRDTGGKVVGVEDCTRWERCEIADLPFGGQYGRCYDPTPSSGGGGGGGGGGGACADDPSCCACCTTGKPCGDACIETTDTCEVFGGCACSD